MNVLKRMIIPKLDLTIHYILSELEELEREDTFRLKRVKEKKMNKVKGDGAGEKIEVTDFVEPKKEKEDASKPEVAKPVEEAKAESDDNELPLLVKPKEAAEMGDLIIIKPPDDRMELGDAFIPPPGMKTMATITEVEELLDGISDLNLKEENKKLTEALPIDENIKEVAEDDAKNYGVNLETGEWFETPSKIANTVKLDVNTSEYNKVDNLNEELEGERKTNDTSAGQIPLKADDSVIDLVDKRGLDSLYRGIDFNFYKPTMDDIFSKHDITIQDSLSLHDFSILDESLLDLESIDFSIDSKGKVAQSKHGTGQSSPVLSTYREVDVATSTARYHENGMLIGPTSRLPSVKWQNNLTENTGLESQTVNGVDNERIELNHETNNEESIIEYIDEVSKDSAKYENIIEARKDSANDDEIKLSKDNDSLKSMDSKTVKNSSDENLTNKSNVRLEETEEWQSDIDQKHKNKISDELKTDKNIKTVGSKNSRSVSDEKLSRISEENNVETDISKLSTFIEEPLEIQINVDKDAKGSVVSDKLGGSRSTFHNRGMPEGFEKIEQKYRQSDLKIDDNQENIKMVSSDRSSHDLQQNKDQTLKNQLGKTTAKENNSEEMAQSETKKLSIQPESIIRNKSIHTNVKNNIDNVDQRKTLEFGQENGRNSLRENKMTKGDNQNANNTDETGMSRLSQEDLQMSKSIPENMSGLDHKINKNLEMQEENLIRSNKETTLWENDDETNPLIIKDDVNIKTDGNEIDSRRSETNEQPNKNNQHGGEDASEKEIDIDQIHKPLHIQDPNTMQRLKKDSSNGNANKEIQEKYQKKEEVSEVVEQEKRNSASRRHSALKNTFGKETVHDESNKTLTVDSNQNLQEIQRKRDRTISNVKRKSQDIKIESTINSEKIAQIKQESQDDRQSEIKDAANKSKDEVKDTNNNKSNDSLDTENKALKIRDSHEIIKARKSRIIQELNRNSQINATDTKDREKRESQEKHEIETDSPGKNNEEYKNKPLRIQNSDEVLKNNQENEITSKNSQTKEQTAENEEKEQSDNERSTSGHKPTRRQNRDDHLKQE